MQMTGYTYKMCHFLTQKHDYLSIETLLFLSNSALVNYYNKLLSNSKWKLALFFIFYLIPYVSFKTMFIEK